LDENDGAADGETSGESDCAHLLAGAAGGVKLAKVSRCGCAAGENMGDRRRREKDFSCDRVAEAFEVAGRVRSVSEPVESLVVFIDEEVAEFVQQGEVLTP
jgi:hypothetical protein